MYEYQIVMFCEWSGECRLLLLLLASPCLYYCCCCNAICLSFTTLYAMVLSRFSSTRSMNGEIVVVVDGDGISLTLYDIVNANRMQHTQTCSSTASRI